jgi:hypothetical protein
VTLLNKEYHVKSNLGNHELLLGTLRKKEFSKEIQGVVAAVLDSRIRIPNPVGNEDIL